MARKTKGKPLKKARTSPASRNTRRKTTPKPWPDGDDEPKFVGLAAEEEEEEEEEEEKEDEDSDATPLSLPADTNAASSPSAALREVSGQSSSASHAVAPDHIILPPHAEDAELKNKVDLHVVPVPQSAKIRSKVTRVLALLRGEEGDAGETRDAKANVDKLPLLVALVARGPGSNKCISIAEIVKRELNEEDIKWCQYTGFWTRLEERKLDVRLVSGKQDSEDDEEKAFEKLDATDRKKVRNMPCLVIYLSTVSVKKLKDAYGEQQSESPRPS